MGGKNHQQINGGDTVDGSWSKISQYLVQNHTKVKLINSACNKSLLRVITFVFAFVVLHLENSDF